MTTTEVRRAAPDLDVPERWRLGPAYVPKGRYTDPEFLQLEIERLFPRTWLNACRFDEVERVGDYVDFQIGDAFQVPQSGTHADYDILYVTETPGGYAMSLRGKKSGIQQTSAQNGDTYESKSFLPDASEVSRIIHYDRLPDGKLLMKDVIEDGNNALSSTHSSLQVSYQSLKGIYFPSVIANIADIDMLQAARQGISMTVTLRNCSIDL